MQICTVFLSFSILYLIPFTLEKPTNQTEVAEKTNESKKSELRERRLLQRKRRKMKELREEIRILTMQLDPQANRDLFENFSEKEEKPSGNRRRHHREEKWNKKLLEKLKHIVNRLDRLERTISTVFKIDRIDGEKPKSTTKSSRRRQKVTKNKNETEMNEKEIRRKLPVIPTKQDFNVCLQHKDCMPGSCCIRRVDNTQRCQILMLGVDALCTDSCQCTPPMSCFQNTNSTMAICKRPTGDDIRNGIYLSKDDKILIQDL
ncbi:unnamed protein product, partial [Mesorhabditis belari]|uniref:Uncharacterized protein n=1 Tax=Mesorhabditis belari TaxID=2138241 RepID=A0AAF3EF68_9BILA